MMHRMHTIRFAAAVAVLFTTTACEAGEDVEDAELDGTDAPIASEPVDIRQPSAATPLMSSRFEAGPAATGDVSGTAQVFAGNVQGGMTSATATSPAGTGATATSPAGTGATATSPAGAGTSPGDPGQGGFSVVVDVRGLSEGEHAWHIHSGPCGEQAPVVAPMTATADREGVDGPLMTGAGGMASDTAFVPDSVLALSALRASPHSLHVHQRGGVDHGPTVACATLGSDTGGARANAPAAPTGR